MYIEHHGVKGQRWGVRRKSGGSAKPASSSKGGPSGDFKKVQKLKAKPVSSLTNKQLKEANERLNLEQNYKRMNPSKVAQGQNAAKAVLATAGIGVATYNLVKSPAGQATLKAGARALGRVLAKGA